MRSRSGGVRQTSLAQALGPRCAIRRFTSRPSRPEVQPLGLAMLMVLLLD
jgi:hypothetical protein